MHPLPLQVTVLITVRPLRKAEQSQQLSHCLGELGALEQVKAADLHLLSSKASGQRLTLAPNNSHQKALLIAVSK